MRGLVLAAALCLVGCAVQADTVTLSWTAPTLREDGSALAAAEIAEYRIAWTLKGAPLAPFAVPGTATAHQLINLAPGNYCFTLKTVDTAGLESPASAEVCRKSRPMSAGGFKVQ